MDAVKYFLALLGGGLLSWGLTPLCIWLAPRMGAVDQPAARRVHARPTPRNGGIAVFLAVQGVLALWFLVLDGTRFSTVISQHTWLVFLGASSALVLVGVIDDVFGVRPILKFGGQIATSAWILSQTELSVGQFLGLELPFWVEFSVGLFWYLLLINAFNLIDGMDGLCSGLAAISCFGIAVSFAIQGHAADAVFALTLMGACLGFLVYNFHPAKIFLGDTGSMFIGFSLATFTLPTAKSVALISLVTPLLVVGVPVFDTALAVWRRSMRSAMDRVLGAERVRHIFAPDREHLHHRLLDAGLSQKAVARVLYGMAFALVVAALLGDLLVDAGGSVYLVGIIALVYVIVRHLVHIELWDTGMLLLEGMARPKNRALRPLLYLIWDVLVVGVSVISAYFLLPHESEGFGKASSVDARYFQVFLATLATMIPSVTLAGGYQRVWSRSGLFDFLALYAGLAVGVGLHLGSAYWVQGPLERIDVGRALLLGSFVFVGVTMGRSVGQVTKLSIVRARQSQSVTREQETAHRLILYGAGENALLLLKQLRMRHPTASVGQRILGFIDDDVSLRRRYVKGYQVLGTLDELDSIAKAKEPNEVVVCQRILPERLEQLRALSRSRGFLLSRWHCGLESMEVIGSRNAHTPTGCEGKSVS